MLNAHKLGAWLQMLLLLTSTLGWVPQWLYIWRNGGASDSRSEGWEFESLCGHISWGPSTLCVVKVPAFFLVPVLPSRPGMAAARASAPALTPSALPPCQATACLEARGSPNNEAEPARSSPRLPSTGHV